MDDNDETGMLEIISRRDAVYNELQIPQVRYRHFLLYKLLFPHKEIPSDMFFDRYGCIIPSTRP